jgi:hypothetical protein
MPESGASPTSVAYARSPNGRLDFPGPPPVLGAFVVTLLGFLQLCDLLGRRRRP